MSFKFKYFCVPAEKQFWIEDDEILADIQEQECLPLLADQNEDQESKAVVWWVIMFISLFQTLHFISDQAITWLVKFLYVLLKYCGRYSPQLNQVADMFPRSLYLRDKYLLSETHSIAFQKYVVCPVYHSLYTYEQCLQKTGTTTLPKSCFNLVQSKRCGESLLRQVVSISGSSRPRLPQQGNMPCILCAWNLIPVF